MSPQSFDTCVDEGGRMSTIELSKDRYMRICYDKQGKSHAGEVKTKKGKLSHASFLNLKGD